MSFLRQMPLTVASRQTRGAVLLTGDYVWPMSPSEKFGTTLSIRNVLCSCAV